MKLLLCSFIIWTIAGCVSAKTIAKQPASNAEAPSIRISLLIENRNNQTGLNDVLSVCQSVRSFKSFSINFISFNKTELQLVYADLTTSQRQELYDQLNAIGVKVITMSGY
jgi:hypothetical protein